MLQELVRYAQQENLAAVPGLKSKTVRWLLVFSPNGKFLGVQDLTGGDKKSKGREFLSCPDLTQPEMIAIGAGCRHFLVDSLDVICLLVKGDEIDEKLKAKHAFCVDLLNRGQECIPELGPIAMTLRDEESLAAIRLKLSEHKPKPTDLATLAITSTSAPSVIVAENRWHDWWQGERVRLVAAKQKKPAGEGKNAQSASLMRCLLSGELVEAMPTHNKISRLSDVGGLAMGDSLVSFDKDAFTSFGLDQGQNAAMSAEMVKTYVTALNHLLDRQSRKLAGVKVVYWYSHRVKPEDDPIPDFFGDGGAKTHDDENDESPGVKTAERSTATSVAGRLLDAFRSGENPDLANYRYCALTLSANSGRVVIRDWMEGQFTELLKSLNMWFEDLSIAHRGGQGLAPRPKFLAVVGAMLRDLRDAPAPLVATLWRCALKRHAIPHHVMAQTLNRVRLGVMCGDTPLHARLGLLKAFCNRNEGIPNMTAELSELETDPAYIYGRTMALLATIQELALPGVGAGIVQRYYAAASATPGLVLGRLVRLAQIGHLPKIKQEGLRISLEKQLTDVFSQLHEKPHKTLTLQEQTLFAIGYYHQTARRYQSKKAAEPSETETPSETN